MVPAEFPVDAKSATAGCHACGTRVDHTGIVVLGSLQRGTLQDDALGVSKNFERWIKPPLANEASEGAHSQGESVKVSRPPMPRLLLHPRNWPEAIAGITPKGQQHCRDDKISR